MNVRIRELMAQAGFDPAAIERMGVMPNAERFAELIARECLSYTESGDIDFVEFMIKRNFGIDQ